MTLININVEVLDHARDLKLPSYSTQNSAGIDLYAAISDDIIIKPNERRLIDTGLKMEIPEGYEGQIRPRSGLALNHGITILNSPGTIDSDYRGEIKLIIINLGNKDFYITKAMKVAQMVINKYEQVSLKKVEHIQSETKRGKGGFGSTGNK